MSYVLALDQGTTSSRAILFDRDGRPAATGQKELAQIFPHAGWVEHDPMEIWTSQVETAIEAIDKAEVRAADVAAIGITNQRETAIVWDRRTGRPIHNAIVWQDRRTADICTAVRAEYGDMIRERTGLETDAYFSASKIKWLLDNIPNARDEAERGHLAFGTVDTWLVWKLTGGRLHLTDSSNASRTMLFDIHRQQWDAELLNIFGLPHTLLPEVRSSSEIYGEVSEPAELAGIKIAGLAGDQQAALFGQACFDTMKAKNTYGTGCFMLRNTGTSAVSSESRLLTTIAWNIDGQTEYALEGSVFIGGAVVQWLRDSLQILNHSRDVEALAGSVPDSGGVYFVPAFAGLGSPYWDQEARGTIVGLTRGTGAAHIARAAIESIAYQTAELLLSMDRDGQSPLDELRVDGGASTNHALLQFQADILQIPVVRSKVVETTALGAAYLAGLATGFWRSRDDIAEHWRADARFEPNLPPDEAEHLFANWKRAVERSLGWAKTKRAE